MYLVSAGQGRLWVITSYFNPARYRRRLLNYRRFRAALRAPLAAVELSFDGEWELAKDDADHLVRVTDGDVMWQKERLLNLLVAQLPQECEFVAWIDADILMRDPAWSQQTIEALAAVPIVQLFSVVRHLGREQNALPNSASYVSSAARAVLSGRPASRVIGTMNTYAHGMGLATTRELLQRHGLYDACVIGGGDTALLGGAYGVPEAIVQCWKMSAAQRDHYSNWAASFYEDIGGRVGTLAGEVHHLWHGDLNDRRYGFRQVDLASHFFDPGSDICLGVDGAWRWASDKPALHSLLGDYFNSRYEDGRPANSSCLGGEDS